jgi:hypothetical protein
MLYKEFAISHVKCVVGALLRVEYRDHDCGGVRGKYIAQLRRFITTKTYYEDNSFAFEASE